MKHKALLMGFFSTIGDVECLEILQDWLKKENIAYDAAAYQPAISAALPNGLAITDIDAADYTHLIVVCGPCWPGVFAEQGVDLWQFEHCVRIGVNLTMVVPLEQWNPFDILLERDSTRTSRPDLSILHDTQRVPLIGTCLIKEQNEYGERQKHRDVLAAIDQLIEKRHLSFVSIDTKWPQARNEGNLASASQIISLMSRVDVVVTNRLHGLIFAIKAGVPVLVLDGIAGGDKVSQQARTIGWPACERVDDLTPDRLAELFNWCLSQQAQYTVTTVQKKAAAGLAGLEDELLSSFHSAVPSSPVPSNTGKLDDYSTSAESKPHLLDRLARKLRLSN